MSTNTRKNCEILTIFAIRDNAHRLGLTTAEVAFLYTVESHGIAFATVETLCNEMRMGRSTFYRVRDHLLELGLIRAETHGRRPSHYVVVSEALSHCGTSESETSHSGTPMSHSGTPMSHSGTPMSHSGTPMSHSGTTDVPYATHRREQEEEHKEEQEGPDAVASSVPSSFLTSSEGSTATGTPQAAQAAVGPFGGTGSFEDVARESSDRERERALKDQERDHKLAERDAFRARLRDEERAKRARLQAGNLTPAEQAHLLSGLLGQGVHA